jgi:hypothetical protein
MPPIDLHSRGSSTMSFLSFNKKGNKKNKSSSGNGDKSSNSNSTSNSNTDSDIVNEDFFARSHDVFDMSQSQSQSQSSSGGGGGLLDMSYSYPSSSLHSTPTTTPTPVSPNSSDLLGLSAGTNYSYAIETKDNSINSNTNGAHESSSSFKNELLGLSYEPSMTVTNAINDNIVNSAEADLLGFTVSPDDNDTHNSGNANGSHNVNKTPQCETMSELLSLESATEFNTNKVAMELNDAYIALEQMRVANLEIEFAHTGTKINTKKCVQCMRIKHAHKTNNNINRPSSASSTKSGSSNIFSFQKTKPCLMCGSPTCKKHSDPNFAKSKIAICADCSPLFSLDFIIECVRLNNAAEDDEDDDNNDNDNNSDDNNDDGNDKSHDNNDNSKETDEHDNEQKQNRNNDKDNACSYSPPQSSPSKPISITAKEQLRRQNIKHMVDVYDRVYLMLTYSAQYIDETALKLESNTKREDRVGLSSNSIGIASGLAGIAAAAAVVTPAGPPLIIASLLFGATAQASSSGSKLVNYHSAPNRIALKIISYYNLLKSILVVTNVLKDALLKDHINLEQYVSNMIKAHDEAMLQLESGYEKKDKGVDDDVDKDIDNFNGGDNVDADANTDNINGKKKDQDIVGNANTATEIDFEDDWETDDDDCTVMSMRSKSSHYTNSQPLGGIKEEKDTDGNEGEDEDFGDFQMADTFETFSTTSSVSPKKASSSVALTISPPNDSKEDTDKNTPPSESTEKNDKEKNYDDAALMERRDTAGKIARFYSRTSLAGTSLIGAATVTVFAGAALSLAHVAFEANNFASTIKRLQAGSPSKRAKVLRNIKEDIKNLPNTTVVAEEWDKYLATLDEKRRNMKREYLNETIERNDSRIDMNTDDDESVVKTLKEERC